MIEGRHLFTSESVTEGHPDKMADQISDAILDEILSQDPYGRVAVETLLTTNTLIIAGEVTTRAKFNAERIAKKTIKSIGYTNPDFGFDYATCDSYVLLHEQSPDIAHGVSKYRKEKPETLGAGDQGLMFGYATDETKELMPLPITLAHKLTKRLASVRKRGVLKYLRPDGKSQVTVEYIDGEPTRIHTVLISTQHGPNVKLPRIKRDIMKHVIEPVLPKGLVDEKLKVFINPSGIFIVGGPHGDTGLTGRKIIVDTYGGMGSHGGGAFSGKDPTKVDRSASYAARWVAKNIVAAQIARRVEVQLAYAIGVARPLSIHVNTFGTGIVDDTRLARAVSKVFDLRPGMLIKQLKLRRPLYRRVAAYGHFGRNELDLPWEKTNKKTALLRELRM